MAAKKQSDQDRQTGEGPLPCPAARGSVPQTLTSTQIIVLTSYVLGGERQPIDTEDLAVKANELAPGRFNWRKYPDQFNLELVRVYASDAKNEAKGALMRGSGDEGWMVTELGVAWAETHLDGLKGLRHARVRNRKADHILKAERARLLASEAFLKLQADPGATVSAREAETFFRLDPYVVANKREERLLRILNAFGDDPELGGIVRRLADQVRKPSETSPT
jgi:hypothetical protein